MSAHEQQEPLRRRVRAAALRGIVRTAGVLPPTALRTSLAAAAPLLLSRRQRAVIAENARIAAPRLDELAAARGLPPLPPPDALARACARFAAEQFTSWIRLARGAGPTDPQGEWVERAVSLDPTVERLDEVLALGRGAIVVTAHLGDWELLCARLRRRGHEGAVVGRVRRKDSSHRWLTDMRRAYGVETIPQDAHPRAAMRVLSRGGVLGLLTDLRVKRLASRPVPFLGAMAPTLTAPAAFARAWRAPLVPARCVRSDRGFTLSVEEPLFLRGDLGRHGAEEDLLRRQNEVFGRWIAESPEQWAWYVPRYGPGV